MKQNYFLKRGATLTAASFAVACGVENEQVGHNDAIQSSQVKFVPRNKERSVTCTTSNKSKFKTFSEGPLKGARVEFKSSDEVDYANPNWINEVAASWTSLRHIDTKTRFVAIEIRNVNGKPHYHYYSNGKQLVIGQNMSSTKVLAQLAALHRIRAASGGELGTDVTIRDDSLGVHSFRWFTHRLHLDSYNGAGNLFKNIAGVGPVNSGSYNATAFVRGWLARDGGELFNGWYGVPRTYDKVYGLSNGSRSVRLQTPQNGVTANLLSPLAMAEFWKRLGVNFRDEKLLPKALHRGADSVENYGYHRRPHRGNHYVGSNYENWKTYLKYEDFRNLFYGNSGNLRGAYNDLGIHSRSGNGRYGSSFGTVGRLNAATNGKWRIFGKTGSNPANNTSAYGAYVCLPEYKGGREFAFFILNRKTAGYHGNVQSVVRKLVDTFAPGIRTGAPRPGPDPDGGNSQPEPTPPPAPEPPPTPEPKYPLANVPQPGKLVARYDTWLTKSMGELSELSESEKCLVPRNAALFYKNARRIDDVYIRVDMSSLSGHCDSDNFGVGDQIYVKAQYYNFFER